MNKIALITGASGGLANAVCRRLADKSWQLVLVSRDASSIQSMASDIGGYTIEADVSKIEGAEYAMEKCISEIGIADALINCAGQILISPLHHTSADQYRACMSANIDTAFFMLQVYINALLKNDTVGSAVMITTAASRIGIKNHEAVSASKAAIEGLIRSAAASYSGLGFRINAIAPGLMETKAVEHLMRNDASKTALAKQYPLGRYGQPDDIAAAIAWLLSEEGSWITGQILPVDGGFSAVRPLVK